MIDKLFLKKVSLSCFMLFSALITSAQKAVDLTPPPLLAVVDDNGQVCGLRYNLEVFNISVVSSKNKFFKNLNDKDFEVFEGKEIREIIFFDFNALNNQYTIGIFNDDTSPESIQRDIKITVKTSKEREKLYGKIIVKIQKRHYLY